MKLHRTTKLTILSTLALAANASAFDQIIRPFQTTRTMSMGGTKILTGLYDENFYGNPARATANPGGRFQIMDFYTEANSTSLGTLGSLVGGGGDLTTKLSSTAGEINHLRLGFTLLGVHVVKEQMSYSFGILGSLQADVGLRRSYRVDPATLLDVGAAFTVARKLLEEDVLSVGLTTHLNYRVSSSQGFSFVDLIKGSSLSPLDSGGDGAALDFDIGGTYKLKEFKPLEFDTEVALTLSNLLGGKHNTFDLDLTKAANVPTPQPLSLGLGISGRKPEMWKFTDFVVAVEFTDIGNNRDGSFWKWVHVGSEAKYKTLVVRGGFNQGYLAAGIGVDLPVVKLDFGTWGEEYSLNPGGLQNRILAARLGFDI